MTGPADKTDWALFEHDDYENGTDDEQADDGDDYGADDDFPPRICGRFYDGQ